LVIENIGNGVAHDLQLTILNGETNITKVLNAFGIFHNKIPYVASKEIINLRKISTLVDEDLCKSKFTIEAKYSDFEKKIIKDVFTFDLSYLNGTFQPVLSPEAKIAKSMENIEKKLTEIFKNIK